MKSTSKTASLALCQFSMGLVYGGIGPTLPTIARNVESNLEQVSIVFTARGIGYLFGTILGGFISRFINSYLYLFITMTMTCVSLFALPHLSTLALLILVFTMIGLMQGGLETLGNLLLLDMWKKDCGPPVQVTKFSFALGASISPLIVSLFFSSESAQVVSCQPDVVNATSEEANAVVGEAESEWRWAFFIYAVFTLFSSVYFFCIAFDDHFSVLDESRSAKQNKNAATGSMMTKFLIFMFFMLYLGSESSTIGYLFTFATSCRIGLDETQGVLLNTVFLASFAAGRFLSIFSAMLLTPTKQLVVNLMGVIVASFVLVASYFYPAHAYYLLVVGIALFGLSIATLPGSCYAWAENHFTVTNQTMILMTVGASLGEMTIPLLVANYVQFFVFFCLVFAFLESLDFALLHVLTPIERDVDKNNNINDVKQQDPSLEALTKIESLDMT